MRDGHPIALSRKEFAVLAELLRADGGVVSAEQLWRRRGRNTPTPSPVRAGF
jgi:DNA-binding response OmpR family regulator